MKSTLKKAANGLATTIFMAAICIAPYSITSAAAPQTNPTPVFRFYKLQDGSHFFTNNEAEKVAVEQRPDVYRYEGIAYYQYTNQVSNSVPVYRFYNFRLGVHFYTANQQEYSNVLNTASRTYRYEGVAYYAMPSAGTALVPVYRFYKFKQGVHFYTSTPAEATYLNNSAFSTYRYEGVAYYSPVDLSFAGSGNQVTQSFILPTALAKISLDYTGQSNFIVLLKEANTGETYSLLANEIGSTSITIPEGIDENRYILEVRSSGPWNINVQLPKLSAGSLTSFNGNGTQATELFTLPAGAHTLNYSYSGSGDFIVCLLDGAGNYVDVPVYDTGPTTGSVLISSDGGDYMMGVTASDNWSMSL